MNRKIESGQTPLMGSAVVDKRGRLSVPKPFRDKLGFYGTITLVELGNCILLIPHQQEFEAVASHIQSIVLQDDKTAEEILAQLPTAGRESFLNRYGKKLTEELEGELCQNEKL